MVMNAKICDMIRIPNLRGAFKGETLLYKKEKGLGGFLNPLLYLVRPAGFEPAAFSSGG